MTTKKKDTGFVADVLASDGNEECKNLILKLGLANESFSGIGTYAITHIFNGRTKTIERWINSQEEIERLLLLWISKGYGIKKVAFLGIGD